MSLTGKSSKSLRKQDLINQKAPAVGFKALRFAHKANVNETGFSLNALRSPTEMTSLGFVQPSASDLQAANLSFYKKNLLLVSSARGAMVEALDFVVGANSQITFTDAFGTALQDEIFVGTIDPVARTGNLLADTLFILVTGTLAAATTDIPVGPSFKTNENSSQQVGAVMVIVDGQPLLRNAGNATASASADGDYQEVDNGSGDCTLIRLNQADPTNPRTYIVMSTAASTFRGDGSVLDQMEKQQGMIDRLVTTTALLAGVPEADFQGAPSNVQLKQFGDTVVNLNNDVRTLVATFSGIKTFSDGIRARATSPGNTTFTFLEDTSFTIALAFGGGNGTASIGLQVCRYTRVNNRVIFQIQFDFSKGTASGDFAISGLPYASANISAQHQALVHIGFGSGFTMPAGRNLVFGVITNNSSSIVTAMQSTTGAGTAPPQATDFAAGPNTVYMMGSYNAATL